MADLEPENVADASMQAVKRPREDGDAPPESSQIVDSSPEDDIVHAAKKLRSDDAVEASIQPIVVEDAPKDMAKANEETEQADVPSGEEVKDETGENTVRVQEEDLHTQDGGNLGEKVKTIEVQDGAKEGVKEVKLGPKVFTSSLDMFNFFYDLLRAWPINFNVNKFEYMMLEDLISKGHQEPQKKIGAGIEAFQVRVNPEFYSRCYYVIRKDGSVEDFSYRKCVDNLMSLPDNMKSPSSDLNLGQKGQRGKGQHDNKGRGGRFGGGGRGRGRGGRKRF